MQVNQIIAGTTDHDDGGDGPKQDYRHVASPPFNGMTTIDAAASSENREKIAIEWEAPLMCALPESSGRSGMPEYRAYAVGLDGHIFSFKALVCDNDQQAIERAKAAFETGAIEVWSGERFVFKLESRNQ